MLADTHEYLTSEQLAELRTMDWFRGLGSVAWTWGWIIACFALYVVYPSVTSVIIAWFIMSGRHLALAVLMHEAAHALLLPDKKWNDRIGQWLTAYPTMADMTLYRKYHFIHHRHTWTDKDPDLGLATALPVTKSSFRRKIIRDLTGETGYKRHKAILRYAAGLKFGGKETGETSRWAITRNLVKNQHGFLITNGLMLAVLTWLGRPEALFLIFWLPGLTGYSVVLRLRAIAEHACITDPSDPLRHTRTTLAPIWLRFLIAPHNVNYHLEHHLFMTTPQYNLPKAHRMLRETGVLDRAEVAPNYLEVLRRVTSVPEHA